jgi:hypothetical protein
MNVDRNRSFPALLGLMTLLLALTIAGCAGPPKQYRLDSVPADQAGTGIVFGRVTGQRFFGAGAYNAELTFGRGFLVKNRATGEKFSYLFTRYFEMRLPAGTYEIPVLSSPAGDLIPRGEGYVFSVKPGKIEYIGSIVGDRDLFRHLEQKKISRDLAATQIISTKEYGLAKRKSAFDSDHVPGEPFIPFFIIDESDGVIEDFVSKHPEFERSQIIIEFAK